MTDLSQMSDDDLMAIAGVKVPPAPDLSQVSDEDLMRAAGMGRPKLEAPVASAEPPSEIGRQLGRTGRSLGVGLASNLDIGRIFSDPLYRMGESAARATGFNDTADTLKRLYSAKTFADASRQSIDEATDNKYTPHNKLEAAVDTASELAASLLGPKAVSSIAGGVSSLWNTAGKGMGKMLSVNPSKVAELSQADIPLTLPAVSDSAPVKTLANVSSELPGGGKLRKTMEGAYKAAEGNLADLGFTGKTTPTMAGETVKNALGRWQDAGRGRFQKIDGALKQMVPDDAASSVASLPQTIKEMVALPGLTPRQVKESLDLPAMRELVNLTKDADVSGNIPYGALKQARTNVGALLNQGPIKTQDDRLASEAYSTLSRAMRESVSNLAGEKGAQAFDLRNQAWSSYMDENKSLVTKLTKKLGDTPEKIFATMTSGDKVGASTASRVMMKLNPAERDIMRDALIYQKGGGENFNIPSWLSSYQKMSPEAKTAFFMGKSDLRNATDALSKALQNYKDVGKFGNPSRSGVVNTLMALVTGGGGLASGGVTGAAGALAGGYAANKAVASAMNSPAFVRWLAQSAAFKSDAQITNHIRLAPKEVATILDAIQNTTHATLPQIQQEKRVALPNY